MRFKSVLAAVLLASLSASCSDGAPAISLTDEEVAQLFAQLLTASAAVDGVNPSGQRVPSSAMKGAAAIRAYAGGASNATTSTINVTADCEGGGTVSIAGSGTDNTTSATFDITESFANCKTDPFTIGGSLHYFGTLTNPNDSTFTLQASMKGGIDVSHTDGRSGRCNIDFTINLSSSGDAFDVSANGTICGRSASGVASIAG